MSLLAQSPFLSGLFLTYASRTATLDGPPAPSPTDQEWMEMKALNNRLQEEIALLRDQSTKETNRDRVADGYVETLRAQLSSVKDTNRDLEAAVSDERAKFEAITSEYANYKKETTATIAELRGAVDKETVSWTKSLKADIRSHFTIGGTNRSESNHRGTTSNPYVDEGEERTSSTASRCYSAAPRIWRSKEALETIKRIHNN